MSEGRYIRQYPDNCSLLSFTGRGVTNTGTTIMKHLFSRMKPSTSCGFIPCLTSLLCLLAIILVSPILLELYFLRDRRISQPASDRPGSCTSALPSSYIACAFNLVSTSNIGTGSIFLMLTNPISPYTRHIRRCIWHSSPHSSFPIGRLWHCAATVHPYQGSSWFWSCVVQYMTRKILIKVCT